MVPKNDIGRVHNRHRHDEPGAGSDLQGIKTTAIKDGNEYVINGQKVL